MSKELLALPQVLTLRDATGVLATLLGGVAQQTTAATVRIDASPLRKFDSSALAVLLECRRVALESGRGFCVDGLPADLQGLANVYGVAPLIAPAPG